MKRTLLLCSVLLILAGYTFWHRHGARLNFVPRQHLALIATKPRHEVWVVEWGRYGRYHFPTVGHFRWPEAYVPTFTVTVTNLTVTTMEYNTNVVRDIPKTWVTNQ